jgi:hypothetical protein
VRDDHDRDDGEAQLGWQILLYVLAAWLIVWM